jgi:tetratricopeptide (TPR) repeat protein
MGGAKEEISKKYTEIFDNLSEYALVGNPDGIYSKLKIIYIPNMSFVLIEDYADGTWQLPGGRERLYKRPFHGGQGISSYYGRGVARFFLKDYSGGFADLEKAIDKDPWVGEAWFYAAYCKSGLQDYKGAIDCLNRGLQVKPNDPEGLYNRGLALLMTGDAKGALPDLEKAVTLRPDEIRAHNVRGQARGQLEDYKGALEDFNFVLKADPKNGQAMYNRAVVKSALGDNAGACADYQQSIRLGSPPQSRLRRFLQVMASSLSKSYKSNN